MTLQPTLFVFAVKMAELCVRDSFLRMHVRARAVVLPLCCLCRWIWVALRLPRCRRWSAATMHDLIVHRRCRWPSTVRICAGPAGAGLDQPATTTTNNNNYQPLIHIVASTAPTYLDVITITNSTYCSIDPPRRWHGWVHRPSTFRRSPLVPP